MKALLLLTALSLAASAFLGGAAPFGRVLLAAQQPWLAAQVFNDTGWQGVALYRQGRFDEAAEAFEAAKAEYNLGNAQAHLGDYAAALEAYDVALMQGDPDAAANFDVVAAFYASLGIDPEALGLFPERKEGPTMDSHVAEGNARAAGSGDEVTNANTMLGLAELDSRGRLGVRRIFDDKFMVADERWLTQLGDVPGEFLKARIAQEHKRRVKAGLSPPKPEDPR